MPLVQSLRTPEHWRLRAEEARRVADEMSNPAARASMLAVAESYDHIALVAEQASAERKQVAKARGAST